MNPIAIPPSTTSILGKRFVSSVMLGMLFILIALLFITLLTGSENSVLNLSGLSVLAWPASLFVLSWPTEKTRAVKTSMRSRNDNAFMAATRPNRAKAVEFFPPWLGSGAFNAA